MTAPQISALDHSEQNTLDELVVQLEDKTRRNLLRAKYYDYKAVLRDMGISIPPQMKRVETVVGWPTKAVDSLARRCNLDGFVVPGGSADDLGITDMWAENRMDIEAPQAHISALIHSVAFIATTQGDTEAGEPEVLMTARDALSGTGLWNPRRRGLAAALSIVENDELGRPIDLVMYLPNRVITMAKTGNVWTVTRRSHNLGRVPVEPLVYRPRLGRPFGSSRISRAVMSITDSAVRTILRSEVSAEFYSSPQRWAMGADESAFVDAQGNPKTPWETLLGRVWAIGRDEDGETPEVGQFPAASMQPHNDQLRSWAMLFCGETSLPVSSLGVLQDNPSSAEAIYAAKEELVIEAEGANAVFGSAWTRSAVTGVQLRDRLDSLPPELARVRAKWRDPATPSKSAAADAVTKQVGLGVLPPDSEVTYEQLGYDQTTIARLLADRRRMGGSAALRAITEAATNGRPAVTVNGDTSAG